MAAPHNLLLCVVDVGLGADDFNDAAHAGRILIGTPDEQPLRTLASNQCMPDGVDYSATTGQVFWTSMGTPPELPNGAVFSCDLAGGARRTILPIGTVHTPKQLVVDDQNAKLYICDREGLRVLRCNLDGTAPEVLIKTGDYNIEEERSDQTRWCVGICLSQTTGKMYWTQKGPSKGNQGRIFRANIDFLPGEDAGNRTDIECVLHRLPEPIDLDIDEKSGKLFWADRGELPLGNSINAVSLDQLVPIEPNCSTPSWPGRDYELLVRNMHEAIGIKLDMHNKCIYATNLGGSVDRFDLDGRNKKTMYQNEGTFAGITLIIAR
ncbi:3-hydroxyacyl-CoA dehydrogenase [Nemania abortiva]|nr:3-hydroxyacyl-CoA dehydrogenase [Nemania abortiva]